MHNNENKSCPLNDPAGVSANRTKAFETKCTCDEPGTLAETQPDLLTRLRSPDALSCQRCKEALYCIEVLQTIVIEQKVLIDMLTSSPTRERIDSLLQTLDKIARDYDQHEYGLPVWGDDDHPQGGPVGALRQAVIDFAKGSL